MVPQLPVPVLRLPTFFQIGCPGLALLLSIPKQTLLPSILPIQLGIVFIKNFTVNIRLPLNYSDNVDKNM
jgi:hypothetical protein